MSVVNGVTTDQPGILGTSSWGFDGSSSYVERSESDFRGSDSTGTIAVWVRADGAGYLVASSSFSENNRYVNFVLTSEGEPHLQTRQQDGATLYNVDGDTSVTLSSPSSNGRAKPIRTTTEQANMSHFEDYQLETLGDLFNVPVLEQSLDQVDSLTPQQEAVLRFIVDNPDEQFLQLQNTFSMPDHLVADLVLDYGTPSDEYDDIRALKQQMRDTYDATK